MPEGGTSLCPGRWHLHPILQRATRTPSLGTVEHPLPQNAGFRPFGQLRRAGSSRLLLEHPYSALIGALVAGATVEHPLPQNVGFRPFGPLRRAGSCWLLLERPHNALTGALVAGATVERPVPQNLGLRLFDPPLLLHDRIARGGGPLRDQLRKALSGAPAGAITHQCLWLQAIVHLPSTATFGLYRSHSSAHNQRSQCRHTQYRFHGVILQRCVTHHL